MSEYVYAESRSGVPLGVSVGLLRKLRGEVLEENVDWGWGRVKGRSCVLYSESGLRKLVEALPVSAELDAEVLAACRVELDVVKEDALLEEDDVREGVVREVEMKVEEKPRNRRLLMCRLEGVDGLQRVRVRDSKRFVRGMVIGPCAHMTGDLWTYTGRMPRFRGRM